MTAASSTFTAHNILLDDGTTTYPTLGYTMAQASNTTETLRLLRIVFGQDLKERSIVDVGCLGLRPN